MHLTLTRFPTPKDPAGHTRVLTIRQDGNGTAIALECACGLVLARGLFAVDDLKNRSTIFAEGRDAHRDHVAAVTKAPNRFPAA